MGYTWMLQTDVMKVNTLPILVGKKQESKFTANTKWYTEPSVNVKSLREFYGEQTITRKCVMFEIAGFYNPLAFLSHKFWEGNSDASKKTNKERHGH